MSITEILHKLVEKVDLSGEETSFALKSIIDGSCSHIEAGAFLFGMRAKGETIEEMTALVKTMREASVKVEVETKNAIDLCGTGGDYAGYFNVSTAAMFVVAGAGVPVLKHGNRSVSSRSGSADVLEALGVKIDLNVGQVQDVYDKTNMVFMFAPNFHPAMKNIVPVRKALKMRTFFNMLGPLLNPAGVKRQMIGTYDTKAAETMASILANLDGERAMTLHAHQGLDEFSVLSQADVFLIEGNQVAQPQVFNPEEIGMYYGDDAPLLGGDKQKNAEIIQTILDGKAKAICEDIVVLNAAQALTVSREDVNLKESIEICRESIRSGSAKNALKSLVKQTQIYN